MTSSCRGRRNSAVCCEHRPQGCGGYLSLQWQPRFLGKNFSQLRNSKVGGKKMTHQLLITVYWSPVLAFSQLDEV